MIYGSSRGRAGGIPYAWLGRVEQSMNKSGGGGKSAARDERGDICILAFLTLARSFRAQGDSTVRRHEGDT